MELKKENGAKLESLINSANEFDEIKLEGEIRLSLSKSNTFVVGKNYSKNIVTITKPNITIDGSGAKIIFEAEENIDTDVNVFFLTGTAKNVQLKNINIECILKAKPTGRQVSAICNTAYGLKVNNSRITMRSDNQISLIGIYNNGNLDTHMETRADNLVIDNCYINTAAYTETFEKESNVYGIYNNLANSISVQNTFIYSTNKGNGERQTATGIYTNGRFGRFIGNNIKANGTHNVGKLKEQAYVTGMVNDGLYNIISSNNIVGEWAGNSVGLLNKGEYAKINGNKILSTHTIKGRSVINISSNCVIDGNILTSTSRNPRLLEFSGQNCIVTNNYLRALLGWTDLRSSCGIYINGDYTENNMITNNIIQNVCDVGIFNLSEKNNRIDNNMITPQPDWKELINQCGRENVSMFGKLDENNILSIYE
jgi:regulator of extracellular matrix RemA (YlzA/DUF370 family)